MITVYGENRTIEELADIPVPETVKGAGSRWKPIQHAALANAVRDAAIKRGWEVKDEKYSVTPDKLDMAGAFDLKIPDGPVVPSGISLAIGFAHDNGRRKALRLVVGASVACCTNGMVSGEILMKRTHTNRVELGAEVSNALDDYLVAANRVPDVIRGLQEAELNKIQADEVLMEAGRAGLVGWSAIGRVDKEYRNPTFAEHGKNTSWALLNAFTYVVRNNIRPDRQMQRYEMFRQLLPTAGLVSEQLATAN